MRVRRKSEIAEAVQWDGTMENWPILSTPEDCGAVKGTWLIFRKEGDRRIWTLESPTAFAAHYEPVPEPTAQTCNCDVEMFGRHHDRCLYSVSEEQPAVARIAEEAKKSATAILIRSRQQKQTERPSRPRIGRPSRWYRRMS